MRASQVLRNYPLAYKLICLLSGLALVAAASGQPQGGPSESGPTGVASAAAVHRTADDRDLFGMVIRDPFYEYNSDPAKYPNALNRTALEAQAADMEAAGVKWVRMEFFADYDGSVARGEINWEKYDWFIKELAPKHGFRVLGLLNVGMVSYQGEPVRTIAFNDPPDSAGSDPNDGSNHFSRVFAARSGAIAARYGTAIAAYEIVNEPNISYDLWQDSHNSAAEIKPERYAALITNSYKAIKTANPLADVIVGGMLLGSPPEGKDRDQFDYLYMLYTSRWVDQYRASGLSSRTGWNVVPWDGVGVHPYFLDTQKMLAFLKDFAGKVRDRSDFKSRLWITEVGAPALPPADKNSKPTQAEIDQDYYLRQIYGGILADRELRERIAHVFWFKYEDFVPGNYVANYGLVRLEENEGGNNYSPSGKVWVHKLAYKAYQELAMGYAITDPLDSSDAESMGDIYFPETGQAIAPQFVAYWRDRGGLERFGYPISRPIMCQGYLSQFFQRAVFEYHPEFAGTPNDVLLRLLGNEYTSDRTFERADPSATPTDRLYYPQTGHTLGGPFQRFWQQTGGLAIYGYPISEEITEVSPTNGETYTVQYFERNRFEYHPEAVGTPYEVQLGLLGANLLKQDRWWR
jgi:hypothetical protein